MPKLFGREPAMLLSLLYAGVALVGGHVLQLDGTKQGLLNAVAAALVGVVVCIVAVKDKLAAGLFALIKVVIASVVGFGLTIKGHQIDGQMQADIMTFVGFALMYCTRQSITAPVTVEGEKALPL